MTDAANRLASIDVPNNRFVIASNESGTIAPVAQTLLPLIPIPYVTSKDAGWNRGLSNNTQARLYCQAQYFNSPRQQESGSRLWTVLDGFHKIIPTSKRFLCGKKIRLGDGN